MYVCVWSKFGSWISNNPQPPPSKIEIIYTSAILLSPSDCSWVRYPSGDFRSIISDIAQDLCSSNCFHNSSSVSPTLKGPPCFELSVRPCNLQCRRKKYKYQGVFLALRFLRELLPPKEILKWIKVWLPMLIFRHYKESNQAVMHLANPTDSGIVNQIQFVNQQGVTKSV